MTDSVRSQACFRIMVSNLSLHSLRIPPPPLPATHQRPVVADEFPDDPAAAFVVLQVLADLDLEVAPALRHVLPAQALDLLPGVPKPSCGRGSNAGEEKSRRGRKIRRGR